MNRIQSIPLKILLPFIVMALFTLMLTSMMVYRYYAQISSLEDSSMETVKQRMSSLQGELEEEFKSNNFDHGERAVSTLGLIHEIHSLAVINENNQILLATDFSWKNQLANIAIADFDESIYFQAQAKKLPIVFLSQNHRNIRAYFPLKLFQNSKEIRSPAIGVIYLDYNLNMPRAMILKSIVLETVIFASVGLVFMGLLISLLNSLVAKPLQNLADTTLRLAHGELGVQLNNYGQGELAKVGNAFNIMSTQVEENIVKLQQSEQNQSITLDSIGDAVIVTTAHGRITRINPVASELTGWPVKEAIGQLISEVFNIINSSTRVPVECPVTQVMKTGNVIGLAKHTALISRNGSEYQIADTAAPILESSGQIHGVVVVFHDVTAEYALQSALRESEARFRNLVETTTDWIWEVDNKGTYTYVSPRCLDILGYAPEEILGKTPFDFMPVNEAKKIGEIFHTLSTDKQAITNLENCNLHKQGHTVVLETSGIPFFDQYGELLGYRGVDRDITHRKQAEATLLETNQRYRTLIDFAPEAMTIFDQDSMKFIDANKNALDLFGMSLEDFLACSPLEISPATQANGKSSIVVAKEHIEEIKQGGQSTFEWLHKNKKGAIFTCEVRLVKLPSADHNLVRGSIIDISERKKTETALAESERRFRQLFEQIPNIAVQGYNKERKVIFWNAASQRLYGYSREETLGVELEKLIIPKEMSNKVVQAIHQWVTEDKEIPSQELELQHKDGFKVPVLSSHIKLHNSQNEPEMYCIDIDLSESRKAQAEIEQLAYFDVLTNLPNRRLFMDRINEEIVFAERHSTSCAILYMDLDNFKTINDSLGHSFGDELLRQVANRVQSQIRSEDTVSRFGGDEFVVLLKELELNPEITVNQIQLVAEKIQIALSQPINIDQHELYITSSIGISLFSAQNNNPAELLKQADTAMYRAKESGRNSIRFFETAMQTAANTRLLLEKDLRLALPRKEFFILYQPQLNLSGKIIGVEALIRWNHPIRGIILPNAFIPVAEETGVILQVGEWVLQTACQQLSKWKKPFPQIDFRVAVNVSPQQFRMTNFVSLTQEIIQQSKINPEYLTFELTEGIVIQDIKDTISKMHALKKIGIRFSIDDFGTGYSSLSYLKRLPLDQLKIDKSFVSDINRDPNGEAIVETIITMAHILGMSVIAEGVENEEQINFLTEKGCEGFQGNYFDKPLTPETISKRLSSSGSNT